MLTNLTSRFLEGLKQQVTYKILLFYVYSIQYRVQINVWASLYAKISNLIFVITSTDHFCFTAENIIGRKLKNLQFFF